MSKKDYIDAMNEIEPRNDLKKETFSKITETKRKQKILYQILSMAAMLIVIVGIGVPIYNRNINKPEILEIGKEERQKEESQLEENLPKVENFENLYAMLKKSSDDTEYYRSWEVGLIESDAVFENATSSPNSTNDEIKGKKDYSETNTQVEGVDEADIVKTDGNYIYYITDNKITITNVDKDGNLKEASKIEFKREEINIRELFVRNNKLVVIGNEWNEETIKPLLADTNNSARKIGGYSSNNYTIIKVYDISNKEKPELARTVKVEGSYLSSRMIDDNVYLMANKYMYSYICREHEIDELNPEAFKPKYIDTANGDEMKCLEFSDICYIPNSDDATYLNVVSFNVTNNEEANVDSYIGAGSEIYSSDKNLYVTKVKYNYKENEARKVITEIYRFVLTGGKCKFEKAGEVPGSVLNQFSMDESGDYFRIATTDYKSWENKDNTNNLYVLDKELNIVGKVEGLAKGERIYSVRFMGDRAYMVTFVQTDPLFVIDLKDPTNPTVLGELKIPGYSKYLHPYDETHLIGFGENTKVVNYGYGDNVVTDGMKMALFDVTDPTNPKEMYSVDIGEKGTYSELLYDHKALLFSKEKNIIAFPISITKEEYNVKFQGAIVYGLNLEDGFTLKGQISHMQDDYDRYNYENRVERIIYINDNLFTLSGGMIKATNINSMEEVDYIDL